MEIYALVGTSGTGKSYKALELAYENDIKYIIDDGLLIHENKIIAGVSAKQAKTVMAAVKRAIFNDENHRKNVKLKLKEENIDKILILGTSDKMINQIIEKLEIKELYKTINIKDISSDHEIAIAKESRKRGNHIIPVPTIEIKPIASGMSINSLKRFFRKNNNSCKIIEKTIIRPTFSYIGKFYINPGVIEQIIYYEISKIEKIEKVNKLDVVNTGNSIDIYLNIKINDVSQINEIYKIQRIIKENVEKITLINVEKVNIYINKLTKNFV